MTPETTPADTRAWSYAAEIESELRVGKDDRDPRYAAEIECDPAGPKSADVRAAEPAPMQPLARFTGEECAVNISHLAQREFTYIALEIAAARYGADSSLTEECERPFLAAHDRALGALDALFEAHVVGGYVPEGTLPGVPAVLGEYCRVCGCSGHDSCVPQCGWAGPGLCTHCAAGEVRARPPGVGTPEQLRRTRDMAEDEWLNRQTSEDGMMRVLATRAGDVAV